MYPIVVFETTLILFSEYYKNIKVDFTKYKIENLQSYRIVLSTEPSCFKSKYLNIW